MPFQLSRKVVQNVHLSGGSLLGVSRGGPKVSDIVDSMEVYIYACALQCNNFLYTESRFDGRKEG